MFSFLVVRAITTQGIHKLGRSFSFNIFEITFSRHIVCVTILGFSLSFLRCLQAIFEMSAVQNTVLKRLLAI